MEQADHVDTSMFGSRSHLSTGRNRSKAAKSQLSSGPTQNAETGTKCKRRGFLRALGTGTAATVVGTAGCLGRAAESVNVLSAGSLVQTFESHVGPEFQAETGITVHGEYYGSNAVMRMVEDRTKHPDVVVSADATLLRERLYGEYLDWDVEFATNVLGIGYNPETAFGRQLEAGEPWYDLVFHIDEGDLVIADPDLDPLGYRAVQAAELAETAHDVDGLRSTLLEKAYQEPEEPQMLAGVEGGARAGAIIYRNMAVDHDVPFLEFPAAYNFSDPTDADHYASAVYTTDEEDYRAIGRPILYSAAVPRAADSPDRGRHLVQFLIDNPDLLLGAGLRVPESLPRTAGEPPTEIQQ